MSFFSSLRSGTKCILCTLFLMQLFLIGVLWIYGQTTEIHSNSNNNPSNEFSRIHFLTSPTPAIESLPTTTDNEDYVLVSDSSGYNISCYKEGLSDSTLEELTTYTGQCSCRPDWHGSNCALPEVVWRALIKSKVTVSLEPKRPRKILYVITGQFSNQNLLEIQINELTSLVDYYIFCQEGNYSFPRTAAVKKSLTFFIQNSTCTPELAFRRFRKELKLEDDDIFVHSNDKEILNRKAVRFFKNFYEERMGMVRFRLKYNVFGFFWQHFKETIVSGTLTTVVNFESGSKQKELVIGDLNHFGGWFCEFCSLSGDIVHEIHVEGQTKNLHHNKNGLVDESYVQYLITNGIYVDGLTKLLKLHKSDYDKYYAPVYALKNIWRFNDLLVNVFLSFNNEADDDDLF